MYNNTVHGPSWAQRVAIFKFAQRCYGLAAVLIWNDFNFEPPFHDIETEIVITYFNLRFAGPNFRRADPVLSCELFKDRDLIFLISEPPVSWILTSIFNKKNSCPMNGSMNE